MTLKAIDTEYKGYRFRSRLEARWAVSFDELGIDYEYELQGFELPSKKRYLPDFYLPEYEIYVEIKPTVHMGKHEIDKLSEFCTFSESLLLFIAGTPTTQKMWMLHQETEELLQEFYDRNLNKVDADDLAEEFLLGVSI